MMLKNNVLFALVFALFLFGCSSTQPMSTTDETPAESTTEDHADDPTSPAANSESTFSGAPEAWFHFDGESDHLQGVSTAKAYQTVLSDKKPRKTVIVAVIDSGVDIEHEDLKDNIWVNEDEVAGNGEDDDNNGYTDDVHGWNFIGGPDGRHIHFDTFEVTRELARLQPQYEDADTTQLSEEERVDYAYYLDVKERYERTYQEMQMIYANLSAAEEAVAQASNIIKEHLGTDTFTMEQVRAIQPTNSTLQQAQGILLYIDELGLDAASIHEQTESIEGRIKYGLNLEFDPRSIVADDYSDPTERYYGNNDVVGPDPHHGTHVSGIIAADRSNDIGIDGIANAVKIMVLRTVPDGDERDKDVANAIRYAVDNGADIINMSFGKELSPHKDVVDAAIRHAVEHDVLLVHGAGNDGANIDTTNNFPSRYYTGRMEQVPTWLEVGASSWEGTDGLAASFSNYGQESVDLFAPGVSIYSTVPGQGYERADGTSMAAPVVSGVAALILSYYPELSATQVRDILLQSVVSHSGQQVMLPGSEDMFVDFGKLSRTGGIVNAYKALMLAEKMTP